MATRTTTRSVRKRTRWTRPELQLFCGLGPSEGLAHVPKHRSLWDLPISKLQQQSWPGRRPGALLARKRIQTEQNVLSLRAQAIEVRPSRLWRWQPRPPKKSEAAQNASAEAQAREAHASPTETIDGKKLLYSTLLYSTLLYATAPTRLPPRRARTSPSPRPSARQDAQYPTCAWLAAHIGSILPESPSLQLREAP